jgi:hypothetical protein
MTPDIGFNTTENIAQLKDFLYSSRRRANSVRLMDTDWPQASKLRELLLEYVSLVPVQGKEMLLLSSIDRGAVVYAKTLGTKPDPKRLHRFLTAVIDNLAKELAGLRVDSPKNNTWAPYMGKPLSIWLDTEGGGTVRKVAPEEGEILRIQKSILDYLKSDLPPAVKELQLGRQ